MPKGNPGGYNVFGDPSSGVKASKATPKRKPRKRKTRKTAMKRRGR